LLIHVVAAILIILSLLSAHRTMTKTPSTLQPITDSCRLRNTSWTCYWSSQSKEVITVGNTQRSPVNRLSHFSWVSYSHCTGYWLTMYMSRNSFVLCC